MLSYFLRCRKGKNPKVVKTRNKRIMVLSKCALCDTTKSKFIKEQEANGFLSSLEIKTPLSQFI